MKNLSVWSLAQYLLRIIFHLSRSVNMLLYSTRPLYLWSTISNHPNIVFPYMFMIYCLSFLTFHHIFNLIWFWILYSYSEFDNDCNMWMLCKEWEHTITHVTYFRIIWYYLTHKYFLFICYIYDLGTRYATILPICTKKLRLLCQKFTNIFSLMNFD